MKRIISYLLTAVLLTAMLTVFVLPASAASDSVENCLRLTSTGSTKIGFDAFPNSSEYKLEYAVNGDPWTQANKDTEINLNDKDFVRFRANGSSGMFAMSSNLIFKMSGDGTVAASGNVMSLMKDDKCCDFCFMRLFAFCTALTAAPELPATTLAENCYTQMFYGCTALKVAPALPATTLAGSCYVQMFLDCTALKVAPKILPATKLAENCYSGMFKGCRALTAAPTLLATETAEACYDVMFENCTSLKTTAEQPETGHYSELRFPNTDCLKIGYGNTSYTFRNVPDMPDIKPNTTYYSPHCDEWTTEYEAEIETVVFEKVFCDSCGEVKSRTEVDRYHQKKNVSDYRTNSDATPDPTPTGSILSGGSLTIIVGIVCSVVFLAVGFFVAMFIFKKKQPALAGGENTNEE